jgi:hypothetical protein
VRDERVERGRLTGVDARRRGARDDDMIVIELPLRIDRIDAGCEEQEEEDRLQNSPLSPTVGTTGSWWNAARCV